MVQIDVVRVRALIRKPDQLDVAMRPSLGRCVAWRGSMPALAIG